MRAVYVVGTLDTKREEWSQFLSMLERPRITRAQT